jgi:hypothetical protein
MMFRIALLALLALAVLPSASSQAFMFCSEPREPSCVEGNGYFDDADQFNGCKSEVEDYVRDVKSYTECLTEEHDKAIRQSNDIIEKFNCSAAGKSYC